MERFFAFARERHSIYLRRKSRQPAPWTDDPVLHKFRFTNVFRELDATTVWYRENVREPLAGRDEILLATVLFRWFNRMKTGEAIFNQTQMWDTSSTTATPWEQLLHTRDVSYLESAIRTFCGKGPYVTGAYIIKTPDGYDKLRGVLQCVKWFMRQETDREVSKYSWRDWAGIIHRGEQGDWITYMGLPTNSLEATWEWLRQFPYLGDFMAYEVVTDLRHTHLLSEAPDIMTWANPGPGAMRGLNRLHDRPLNGKGNRDRFIQEMRELLAQSADPDNWPQSIMPDEIVLSETVGDHIGRDLCVPSYWPQWEMRDIEHTLCEFDKYERARLGEGKPRGVYHR